MDVRDQYTYVRRKRRKRKKHKTLDKYILAAAAYIVAWSIVFFVSWVAMRIEPGILEGCILAPGVVEMVACAFIKCGKEKYGSNTDVTGDMQCGDSTDR